MTKLCWTALEARNECARLAALVGPKCEVFINISGHRSDDAVCSISVYSSGMIDTRKAERFPGKTFAECFDAANEYCIGATDKYTADLVRRMGLAIIDITDRLGACSDLNLKAENFSRDEIASYHIQACEAASRMSGNAPFAVVMSVRAAA